MLTVKDFRTLIILLLFGAGLLVALVLFIAGLLALVSAVQAAPCVDHGLAVTLPPVQYDHEPTVKYRIRAVTEDQLYRMCPNISRFGARLLACSRDFGPLGWEIMILKPFADDCYLQRHEKGHANGWLASHPGWRLIGGRE